MPARSLIELGLAEQEAVDDAVEAQIERAWRRLWPGLLRELLATRDAPGRLAIAQEFASAVVAAAVPRKIASRALDGAAGRAAGLLALRRRA